MKQSNMSENKIIKPAGRRRAARRTAPASKKLTVIISAVLAVLMLAASGIYAWFSSQKDYIRGQIDIGTMEVVIHVYKLENGQLVELDGSDGNPAHTGQSTANSEGIITYADWDANSAGVRYIAIENNGSIDVKSYLTLQGILGSSMNENSLDYFHFLINALPELPSSGLNEAALENYAEGYETAGTQLTAPDIANHSSSFKLTNYTKTSRIGSINRRSVNYYRLDFCCYNLPTQYVPTPTEVASSDVSGYYAQINASVVIKQMNAPENDDDNSGNNTYVDSSETFIQAVNAAANNDTIFLTSDVEVNDSITIRQRVNINLNGHTLTVNGNLAYDTASAGYCSLVITGGSRLYVLGDLIIDMPNARFELFGSGSTTSAYASIVLGYIDSNNTMQGGRFYVNCLRDYSHIEYGYTQTAAQVWNCLNMLATMEVGSETGVYISANSTTGVIKAAHASHDIAVYNYGEIQQIDLTEMVGSGTGHEQIYILNANKFTSSDEGGDAAVLMPSWAVGHITCTNDGRDYNARAINAAGANTDWHVYGANWFFDIDIESGYDPDTGKVIRVSSGEYIVNLVDADDRVGDLLAAYFAGDGAQYAAEAGYITSLTVLTYEDGAMTQADFDYIRLNLNLTYLNLSNAIMAGGVIPASAMYGESSLTELVLPISEISIGANAFAGTSIEFLTISNNITSIGQNAFYVAEGRNIYITWDSTVPVDDSILLGFAMDRTVIFMYDYLLDDFRTNNPAYAYRAYEVYDFFDENTNGFYKILNGSSAQLIYYRGVINNAGTSALPIPNTVIYGGVTYNVITLGEHCYRLSISLAPNAQLTVNIPENVRTVEEGVFYRAKISALSLNNVTSIGADAFRSTVITYSNERPSTFAGMTYLGAYAFGGAVLGTNYSGSINESIIEGMASSGTLDLSGRYTPANNAFYGFNVWRGTLKLERLISVSASVTNSMTLYGSTLSLNGCDEVFSSAFDSKFHSAGVNYNNIDARNIKRLGGNAFNGSMLNTVDIGLAAEMYSSQAAVDLDCRYGSIVGSTSTAGVFGTNTSIRVLNITGWLPGSASSSNQNALFGGPNTYGEVNIDYAGTELPDYMFYTGNTIGTLTITGNAEAIGAYAFHGCIFGNTELDVSEINYVGGSAFRNAKLDQITLLDFADGAELGNYCFADANLSSVTSINISNGSTLGSNCFSGANLSSLETLVLSNNESISANCFAGANLRRLTSIDVHDTVTVADNAFYQITGGGITHIDVSGVYSIGANAFCGIKNNGNSVVDRIDITEAMTVGNYAFGGLNIAEVDVGNTEYRTNHSSEYAFGTYLFYAAGIDNTIDLFNIVEELPDSCANAFGASSGVLLTYESIVVSENCTVLPYRCFRPGSIYDFSNNKGTLIKGFTSNGELNIGSEVFFNVAFSGTMNFDKVINIESSAFKYAKVLSNSYWSFDSILELSGSDAFREMEGEPLTMSFMSIRSISASSCFMYNTAVQRIIFGPYLSSISARYFIQGAVNLKTIMIQSNQIPVLADNTFSNGGPNGSIYGDTPAPGHGTDSGLTIYVPADLLSAYETAAYWRLLYNAGYLMSMNNVMTSDDNTYTVRIIDYGSRASIQGYLGASSSETIPGTISVNGVSYTVAEIDAGAFSHTTLTSVTIPASVVYIDPAAFTGSSITVINIASGNPNYTAADGVLYAYNGTVLVYYCGAKAGTSFTVPASVTTVAKDAFMDAVNLTELTMSSVATIDGTAFGGSCRITTFNFNSATPPVLLSNDVFGLGRIFEVDTNDIVHYVDKGDFTINIPTGSFAAYANGINWHPYIQSLNESSALTGVVEPAAALRYAGFSYRIDENGCAVITGYSGADGVVTIPDRVANETGVLVDVADIAPDAFNGRGVTAYAVSAANRYFAVDEDGVLYSKDGTRLIRYPAASENTGYEVPAEVMRIESYAFADADKLETVYIPTSAMLNMGEQVFRGCSDRLALYGGAAANPFAVDIPEAIMPDKQGGAEDGEDGEDGSEDAAEGRGND